jgi:large subunit ribosomal protein L7/L12
MADDTTTDASVNAEEVKDTAEAQAPAVEEPKVEEKKKKEDNNDVSSEEKEKVEIPKKFEKLVKEIETLSVLELSELVKVLEGHFGVSAAAPMAVAAAPAAGGGGDEAAASEKSDFDVILKDAGAQKVAVIKAVKDITQLGLGDAKAIVDGAPKPVLEKAKKEDAEAAKATLEAAGATVELV